MLGRHGSMDIVAKALDWGSEDQSSLKPDILQGLYRLVSHVTTLDLRFFICKMRNSVSFLAEQL